VAVAELTGAELRTVIRQCSGANVGFGASDWWNGHLSGLSVVWDRSDGEIVTLSVDGSPVDGDETYSVATADFLFYTTEEFPVLDESHRRGTLDTQYRVMADYAPRRGDRPAGRGPNRLPVAEPLYRGAVNEPLMTQVVVPVRYPLTKHSRATLAEGIRVAEERGANLSILHVNLYQQGRGITRRQLKEAVQEAFGHLPRTRYVVRSGLLVEETILEEIAARRPTSSSSGRSRPAGGAR